MLAAYLAERAESASIATVRMAKAAVAFVHLRSLRRCETYAAMPDEGKALEAALTAGISCHGPNSNHGHGFRPIFTGLVNLHGELRFRSGEHAVTMDGTSPELTTARITQKAPIDGFFASVRCHAKQQ